MWARWWIQQVHIHCEIEELMERFCVTMNTAGCQSKCWFFCHLFSSTTSFLTCKMTITSKMRALLSTQDSTYRKIYATKKKSLWVLFEVPSSQLRTFEATENPFLTCSNMVNLGRKVSDAHIRHIWNFKLRNLLWVQWGDIFPKIERLKLHAFSRVEERKKCSYHPSLVYTNRGASQVAWNISNVFLMVHQFNKECIHKCGYSLDCSSSLNLNQWYIC
jgi:hypothetical protein